MVYIKLLAYRARKERMKRDEVEEYQGSEGGGKVPEVVNPVVSVPVTSDDCSTE